jgi:hypothetical protein
MCFIKHNKSQLKAIFNDVFTRNSLIFNFASIKVQHAKKLTL